MSESIKYRFEIWYQTKNLKMMSDFLGKCDLGIDGLIEKDVITFTYTAEEKPIFYFKDLIRQAIEGCGGTVIKVKGGKIE